jgi:hypothetical protein
MTNLASQFSAHLQRRIEANLVIAGEMIATEVRRNIQKSPRGGMTYVLTNPNRVHKASAAGESPATDLGFLVRSIQTEPDMPNLRIRILSLKSIAPYAKRLEFGDMSAGLLPRPFMFKALAAKKQKAIDIIQKSVSQATRDMQGARI